MSASPAYGTPFDEVVEYELTQIADRRRQVDAGYEPPVVPADPGASPVEAARRKALEHDLVGLAFSGGGIRSATFCLGVLQALGGRGLLRRVDYLSTVSGGGYAGGWLAAWVKREGSLANVEVQLSPRRTDQAAADRIPVAGALPLTGVVDDEPEPLHHLRAYSRYLTPRPGLLSADTWTLVTLYLRNLLINLLPLALLGLAFVFLARLGVLLYGHAIVPNWVTLALATVFLVCALTRHITAQWQLERADPEWTGVRDVGGAEQPAAVFWLIAVPICLAAVFAAWLFGIDPRATHATPGWQVVGAPVTLFERNDPAKPANLFDPHDPAASQLRLPGCQSISDWRGWKDWPGWAKLGTSFGVVFSLFGLVSYALAGKRRWVGVFLSYPAMGAVAGLSLYAVLYLVIWPNFDRPEVVAAFGPPALAFAALLAVFVQVAVAGPGLTEYQREWLARLGAYVLLLTVAWLVVFAATLYLPWGFQSISAATWSGWAARIKWGAVAAWVATTAASVVAGRSPRTGPGVADVSVWARLLVALGPPVFVVGLFGLLGAAAGELARFHLETGGHLRFHPAGDFLADARTAPPLGALVWLAITGATGIVILWFINVNHYSMYATYANRLARCYLGASRRKAQWAERFRDGVWQPGDGGAPTGADGPTRLASLFTGFDPVDDLPLAELRRTAATPYAGPYPLFNTSLNLVAGAELAYQDRKADAFVLTPDYCGSRLTGYGRTPDTGRDRWHVTLGRAVAISGAAADPNMGVHQSPALTFLMTVFNARLGWWIENPHRGTGWTGAGPHSGWLLLRELLGLTDQHSDFVHLSDGGHFENLGVYELIRRRTRFIVTVDAAEDRRDASENLANLIRLVRTDFGIRIDIDTTPLREDESGRSRWHCAVGTIRYDDVDARAVAGTLVFIRASLTGDEPADVKNYAAVNPAFPHDPTANQFFDEAQFESYRALGYHIGRDVFDPVSDQPAEPGEEYQRATRRFFSALRQNWTALPPDLDKKYAEIADQWFGLSRDLARDTNLRDFNHALYPELVALGLADPADQQAVAELRTIGRAVSLMEAYWMGVRLDTNQALPVNRGWLNTFRRWARTERFFDIWPVIAGTYNREFVQFCNRALNLPDVLVRVVPGREFMTRHPATVRQHLVAEYAREWAERFMTFDRDARRYRPPGSVEIDEFGRGPSMLVRDLARALAASRAVWYIAMEPASEFLRLRRVRGGQTRQYPVGVALLLPEGTDMHLVFWLRGAHRSFTIGRSAFDALLRDVLEHGVPASTVPYAPFKHLIVRCPYTANSPAEATLQTMWLNFFYDYNFRRRRSVDGSPDPIVLEYRLGM